MKQCFGRYRDCKRCRKCKLKEECVLYMVERFFKMVRVVKNGSC